jgi:hypothetical protein
VAKALVLLMSLELVWVVVMPGPTDRIVVPAAIAFETTVGFVHQSPPPWPQGNCFDVSSKGHWLGPARGFQRMGGKVCNMHSENFSAIVQRLKLRAVEIQPIDQRCCMITDSRIPREWLLERPCATCFREPQGEDFVRRYPEQFRPSLSP